jgi:hypothetical protein
VVRQEFGGGLCDQDMVAALDGIECDGVVCCVWGKNRDGRVGRKSVDGGFVGVWVRAIVLRVAGEGDVEVVVCEGDLLVQVIADGREFGSRHAGHGEVRHFATSA